MIRLSINPDALGGGGDGVVGGSYVLLHISFVSLPTVEHTMLQGAIKKELDNSRLKKNSQIKHLFETKSVYTLQLCQM